MRQRRAISETVAALVLMGVIATASFFAMSNASKNTVNQELSISDAIAQKSSRTQELVSIITKEVISSNIILEVLNYGQKDITIKDVLVDGTATNYYTLTTSDGFILTNKTMTPHEILKLQVNGTGQSIQVITKSNNVLNLPLD